MKKLLIPLLVSVFVGGALVAFRDRLGKVWASPDEIIVVKKDQENIKVEQKELREGQKVLIEQTTTIGQYIKQQEEMREKAPAGYRWDSDAKEYIKVKK